jgi:hypothetical protein
MESTGWAAGAMVLSPAQEKALAAPVREALERLRERRGDQYGFGVTGLSKPAAWRLDGTGGRLTADTADALAALVEADRSERS